MGSNRNYIFMLTFDSLGGPLLSHLLPPSLRLSSDSELGLARGGSPRPAVQAI